MLRRILFLKTLLFVVIALWNPNKCFSWGFYGDWGQQYYGLYGSLFHLQNNQSNPIQYPYKVFYYNGTDTANVVTDADLSAGGWTRSSYAQNIANAANWYNDKHLGITFVYDGWDYTTVGISGTYDLYGAAGKTGYRGSVGIYKSLGAGGLAAPFSTNWYGMKLGLNTQNPSHDYDHELSHCLGFGHNFDQQGAGYGNRSCWYAPVVYGIAFKGAKEDVLNGMWIAYGNTFTGDYAKISGTISSNYSNFYNQGWAEAYLFNAYTKQMWYQSPVDRNGYFEFKCKLVPPNGMFILMVASRNMNYSFRYPFVKGTNWSNDGKEYYCYIGHTSSSNTRPTSGSNWGSYWRITNKDVYGSTWESGREYIPETGNGIMNYNTVSLPPISIGGNIHIPNIEPSNTYNSLSGIEGVTGLTLLYPQRD